MNQPRNAAVFVAVADAGPSGPPIFLARLLLSRHQYFRVLHVGWTVDCGGPDACVPGR